MSAQISSSEIAPATLTRNRTSSKTCSVRNTPNNTPKHLYRHNPMRHHPLLIAAVLFSTAQFVASWGADTHPTIGYLAERFLLNDTVLDSVVWCGVDDRSLRFKRFSRMNLSFMDRWVARQIGLTDKVAMTPIVDGTLLMRMIGTALPLCPLTLLYPFHRVAANKEAHRSIVP